MALLEVKSLTHTFPDGKTVIKDVCFTLEKGSFNILAGRNGSGKTVLMKHLNGLLRPTSGDVLFQNKSIWEDKTRTRLKVGLVFQDPDSCLVGQTVMEDTAFGLENLGVPAGEIERKVENILKKLDLWDKRHSPPRFLSGGEKKRLTVAGILVMEPELLILDEPFVGLDYPGVQEVLKLLIDLHSQGQTIMVITHDLEKVLAHADKLFLLDDGILEKSGHPTDLLGDLENFGIRRPPERRIEEMTWLFSYLNPA